MGNLCDLEGICQYDRSCPFFAENCRLDLRDREPEAEAG